MVKLHVKLTRIDLKDIIQYITHHSDEFILVVGEQLDSLLWKIDHLSILICLVQNAEDETTKAEKLKMKFQCESLWCLIRNKKGERERE